MARKIKLKINTPEELMRYIYENQIIQCSTKFYGIRQEHCDTICPLQKKGCNIGRKKVQAAEVWLKLNYLEKLK